MAPTAVLAGRSFRKMSGSGNDFVVVDGIAEPLATLPDAAEVRRICERGSGVGADGLVILQPAQDAAARMIYFNRDGSRGEMCGNAALCCTRLAAELGYGGGERFLLATDSGWLQVGTDGSPRRPWIELPAVEALTVEAPVARVAGEERIGFARVGVPHFVVLCAGGVEPAVAERGAELRHDASQPAGANVNFVIPPATGGAPWRIRTFERGVEAETLACGTGTGASAVLLAAWGLAPQGRTLELATRSGLPLRVELPPAGATPVRPRLSGEGRLVFEGRLLELS